MEQKVSREGPGWEQRPIVTHLQAARLQLSPSRCQRAKDKQPSAPAANSSTSAGSSAQTNRTHRCLRSIRVPTATPRRGTERSFLHYVTPRTAVV